MVTCNHCGSELVIEAGRCTACGEETAVAERREALRVDSTRLDEVPRRDTAPVPGEWGRSDDDPSTPSVEVRQLRPTPEPDPGTGPGSGPEPVAGATPVDVESPASGQGPATPDDGAAVEDRPSSDPPPPRARAEAHAPPLLASDLLRRELSPAHPHPLAGRLVALLAALGGGAAVALTLGTRGPGAGLLAGFAAFGAMGVAPMPYGVRAAVLSLISAAGVGGTLWVRTAAGAHDELLPVAMVVMAASALFFRAWHRGSTLARVLVAVGIVLGVGWLGSRGGVATLSAVDIAWQSWVPQVMKLLLALLMLLSLLAFMDARSTGGCSTWATGLLLWYGADVGFKFWVQLEQGGGLAALPPWVSLAYLATPPLTAVLTISVAQLLAVTQASPEGAPG